MVDGVDIGRVAERFFGAAVGFDGLGGADLDALSAALAGVEEGALGQGAGWAQAGTLLRQVFFGVGGGRVDDALEEGAEKAAAVLVWGIHGGELGLSIKRSFK